MSVTKSEHDEVRAILREAKISEDLIDRILVKPKRAYSRDSSWKDECHRLYLENGVISRQQIKSSEGFPASSNPSQTVNRFIKALSKKVGHGLILDKVSDSWSRDIDHSQHYDALFAIISEKREINKKTFVKFCEDRGLNQGHAKSEMQSRGVTVYLNGLMEVKQ